MFFITWLRLCFVDTLQRFRYSQCPSCSKWVCYSNIFWNNRKHCYHYQACVVEVGRSLVLSSRQARNQLWTPGGAKSFLRGAKIFGTMSNIFKLRPTHFSKGDKKFSRGGFAPPMVTDLVVGVGKKSFKKIWLRADLLDDCDHCCHSVMKKTRHTKCF